MNHLPTNVPDAASIEIPDEFKVDGTNRQFLQADITTTDNKRVLIFGTDSLLDAVNTSEASIGFADGTFRSCPLQFSQIWIVRVKIRGANLPILYALLEDKSTLSYWAVLNFLHLKCPRFSPITFVMDYEAAEHKAAMKVFQDSGGSYSGVLVSILSTTEQAL